MVACENLRCIEHVIRHMKVTRYTLGDVVVDVSGISTQIVHRQFQHSDRNGRSRSLSVMKHELHTTHHRFWQQRPVKS